MSTVDVEASWLRAWRGVGARESGTAVFQSLLARYNEPHRRYHTVQHLSECLASFQQVSHLAAHPAQVETALWFHDAVYDVKRSDNEERSAQWAETELKAGGAPAATAERVSLLVRVTKHTGVPATPDEQLLVDIDLGILGASEERLAEY